MSVTFQVKNKKYIYYSFYASDGRLLNSTGLKCNKSDFDNGNVPKHIQKRMNAITVSVDKYCDRCVFANERILSCNVEQIILEGLGKTRVTIPIYT